MYISRTADPILVLFALISLIIAFHAESKYVHMSRNLNRYIWKNKIKHYV